MITGLDTLKEKKGKEKVKKSQVLQDQLKQRQRVLQQHSLPRHDEACEEWVLFCAVPSTAFAGAALARAGFSKRKPESKLSATSDNHGVRGVLKRGPSEERKSQKRVEVEDGRRQVVWGSDGVQVRFCNEGMMFSHGA